jgi:hypothetical protein
MVLLPILLLLNRPATSAVRQKSLYQQVVEKPDSNNGYEDYLRAADTVNDGCGDLYYRWKPNAGAVADDPDLPPNLTEKRKEIAESLKSADYLEVENQMTERYGRALEALRIGNGKTSWNPRVKPAEHLVEFDAFKTLANLCSADAYVKFSKGDSGQGVKDLLDGMTFAANIQSGSTMNWLLGMAYDDTYFTSFDRFLGSLSQKDCAKIIAYSDKWLSQPDSYVAMVKETQKWNVGRIAGILDQYRERYNAGNERPSNVQEFIGKMTASQLNEAKNRIEDGIILRTTDFLRRFEGPESQWYQKRPWERHPETPFPNMDDFVAYLIDLFTPSDMSRFVVEDRAMMRLLGLHAWVLDYRFRMGKLPGRLSDAVPLSLIKDPLTDGEFVYEAREDGKYKLYSKGLPDLGPIELRPNRTTATAVPPTTAYCAISASSQLGCNIGVPPIETVMWIDANAGIGPIAAEQMPQKSLYGQVITHPDPNNGYDDYVRAADVVNGVDADLYFYWAPKQYDEMLAAKQAALEREKTLPKDAGAGALAEYGWDDHQERRLQIAKALHEKDFLNAQRLIVRNCGAALDLVRTGNLKRAWDPREKLDAATLYPELAHFKDLVRLFRADAWVHFADGDSKTGSDDLVQAYEFSRRLGGGNLICELVGIACESITLLAFQEDLDHLSASDTKAIAAYTDLAINEPPSYLRSLERERGASLANVDMLLKSPWTDVAQDLGGGGDKEGLGKFVDGLSAGQRQTLKAGLVRSINDTFNRLADRMGQDESTWGDNLENPNAPPADKIANIEDAVDAIVDFLLPTFEQATLSVMRSRSQLRLLVLHARVLDFRWHNNRYPTDLAEAAPEKMCADPISKGRFQYELLDIGYRLYSRGSPKTGPIELRYKRPRNLGQYDDGAIPPR